MSLNETETFEVKDYHIKLLRESYVSWNDMESGAPSIDPKRPYGDKGIIRSVAKIVGKENELFDEMGLRIGQDGEYEELYSIHEEMKTVLGILLDNPVEGIQEGKYERKKYSGTWSKSD